MTRLTCTHCQLSIPGTKRRQYLQENIDAVELRLTREQVAEIDAIFPLGSAQGLRYPAAMMSSVGR